MNAAFASYTAGNGNALLDDVHITPNSEYETAERVELAYNAASGVGAAHQGVAALSGFYGAMDNVFAGSFSCGGGGVYRGQVCEPCSQVGCLSPKGNSASRREAGYQNNSASRREAGYQNKAGYLERAVWVMPIYGHQSAADLHSGGVKYGYTSDQYAAVFGTEVKSGRTRFGIAGNVGIGRTVSPGAAIHTNSDLTFGGVSLYAVQKFGRVESNAQVGWIGTRNEMHQRNGTFNVNANIDGGVVFTSVGFERPYRVGRLTVAPTLAFEYTHVYQNAFNTFGGGTQQFTAQSGSANMLHIPVGFKASAQYCTRFGKLSPDSVRWRSRLGIQQPRHWQHRRRHDAECYLRLVRWRRNLWLDAEARKHRAWWWLLGDVLRSLQQPQPDRNDPTDILTLGRFSSLSNVWAVHEPPTRKTTVLGAISRSPLRCLMAGGMKRTRAMTLNDQSTQNRVIAAQGILPAFIPPTFAATRSRRKL